MTNYLNNKNTLLNKLQENHPLMAMIQPLKEVIQEDLAVISPKFSLVDYPFIFQDNAQGNRFHDLADHIAHNASIEDKHILYQICALRQNNIRSILLKLIDPSHTILEIGCGILDNRGDSFISAALGRRINPQFLFTDINPSIIEKSKENKNQVNIEVVDSRKLTHTLGKAQFDLIVGHNALDTLSMKDLAASLYETRCCLKKTGQFVHLLSMPPFSHSAIHELCQKDQIVFPLYDHPPQNAFFLLDEKIYQQKKESLNTLDTIETLFLEYLLTLNHQQMERFCNAIIALKDQEPIIQLINKLQNIGILINHLDYHIQNMVHELTKQGLNVKQKKLFHEEKIIKVQVNGSYEGKCMEYGPKGKIVTDDPTLSWGEGRLKIPTHAIVADILV
jgi:cyclopropane fatty-acyl-phospholipid synthase-like methyltransferase